MKIKIENVFEEIGYSCQDEELEDTILERFEKIKRNNHSIRNNPIKKYKYPSLSQHMEALKR